MRHHILYIILTILTGVACLTSCTKEYEPLNTEDSSPAEMTFEVGDLTRTPVTTTSTLINQPFKLFGAAQRRGEFFKGFRELFNDTEVTYDKTRNIWDYGTPQYWEMGQEHSFVALHPYDIPGMSDLSYENHEVRFTYTMPEESDDERDVLFATHRRMYNMDESDAVRFRFQHLLTKINVAPNLKEDLMFAADDEGKVDYEFGYQLIKNEYIQIRYVELKGFRTIAHVAIKPADLGDGKRTDDPEVTVEIQGDEGEPIAFRYDDEETAPRIYNDGKPVSVIDKDDPIVIIPQRFGNNASIYMEYTVNTDKKEDPVRSITIPLESTKLDFGKIYTLCFTIEKVYAGQIKPGSLTWEVTDVTNKKDNDDWIEARPDNPEDQNDPYDDDGVIRQGFKSPRIKTQISSNSGKR